MRALEANTIRHSLKCLGFESDIEEVGNEYQVRGYTKFASVLFSDFENAKGFLDGVSYTLHNMRKPELF